MEIFFIIIPIVFVIYILPSIIAFKRKHNNRIPILIVNLILSWTFIVWVVCLAWSFSADVEGGSSSTETKDA